MTRLIVEAAMATALLLCAGLLGYAHSQGKAQAKVATARSDTDACLDASAGQQLALDKIAADLSQLRVRHNEALAAGNAALREQLAENLRLRDAAIASTHFIKETADADPDCAAVSRKPVCSAIADRLWPTAAAPSGGQQTGVD